MAKSGEIGCFMTLRDVKRDRLIDGLSKIWFDMPSTYTSAIQRHNSGFIQMCSCEDTGIYCTKTGCWYTTCLVSFWQQHFLLWFCHAVVKYWWFLHNFWKYAIILCSFCSNISTDILQTLVWGKITEGREWGHKTTYGSCVISLVTVNG